MRLRPSLFASLVLAAPAAAQSFDFLPAEVSASADFAVGLTDADLNHDQVPDLLVVSHCPPRAICLFNDGAGHFYFAGDIPLPSGARAADVAKGDFDGDGQEEFAIVMIAAGQLDVYQNQGGGAFAVVTTLTTAPAPRGLDVADYDGDGDLDLAVATASDEVDVFENLGGFAFGPVQALPTAAGSTPHDVAFGDYDGDGDLDLAASAIGAGTLSLFRFGGGVFTGVQVQTLGGGMIPRGLDAADLDGDGDDDLVAAANGPAGGYGSVLLAAGGLLGAPASYPSGGAAAAEVALADLDGDGQLDAALVNRNSGTIALLPQIGGGAFGPVQLETTGGFPVNLVAADFDANLRPDLATACALTAVNSHLNVTGAVQLSQTGSCPGTVTIDLSGATPNSTVEVWLAQAGGRAPLPSGHACSGVLTGLDATLRLAGTLTTGPTGAASQSVSLPPGACGRLIQVVDPGVCAVSNVWLLR